MKIYGITTCVGFADMLRKTGDAWKVTLDKMLVLTSHEDNETQALCMEKGFAFLITDAFGKDGAHFNKAAAMDDGIETIGAMGDVEWVLFFDADVMPPADWREKAKHLAPGYLYGAFRSDESGGQISVGDEIGGFFQLWHWRDVRAADRPLLGSWDNASGYDSEFMLRWPHVYRETLPIVLTHYGKPGERWMGPGTGAEDVAELQRKRQAAGKGSWRKERLG